jgi:iron complex outermembrane recepter protein
MQKQVSQIRNRGRQNRMPLPAMTSISAAVFLALYGLPHAAFAQQAPAPSTSTSTSMPTPTPTPSTDTGDLQEITVTANRRAQTVEAVPYSLSVVSADQLSSTGVTDMASLAAEVPGLSLYDEGARLAGATAPIIRGINASSEPRGFRSFEQDPVGTYIGNSPIDGYFQLDDLQQVEVLRGPQGTLYGAGSLGGAVRLIPNAPELGTFSGKIEAGGSRIANSSGTGYNLDGFINIPVGDTLAFRVSAKYGYDPGYIDAYGLLKRTNNSLTGVPLLADPGDPVSSPGIYSNQSDWNWEKTFTGRAAALWKPNDDFSATLAILNSSVQGNGGPVVNPEFPGGVSPLDPQTTLPAGGRYQEFSQIEQPFSRYTNLLSLDMSYDVGFATLSSTSSYHTTTGSTLEDNTYDLAGVGGGSYLPYYAGSPTNPRFVYDELFTDHEHTFSEELRLVSKSDPANLFDYVVGAYYENQTREGAWSIANPGSPERSVAQGCTGAIYYGSTNPNCLLTSGPNDVVFNQTDTQNFQDKSVFGELTWHFMPHGQITGGFRHFDQEFTDAQSYQDYAFPTNVAPTQHSAPASANTGKVDPSYEYADHQYVYALWSQGFRRGGANALPITGPFAESTELETYKPDKTNNYEAGLKGRFSNGVSYTFDVFDIKWDNPQISASLPSGDIAVYNGKTAESTGFEFESSGPLLLPVSGFGYNVGFTFADARLTSDFSLPANNGAGVIIPGLVSGKAGEQLPGSPRTSTQATLTYDRIVTPGYDMTLSLNGTYRSDIKMNLASEVGTTSVEQSSSYLVFNFSAALNHNPWRLTGYVTNLLNKEEILVPPTQPNEVGGLTNDNVINQPRTIGFKAAYSF